MDKDIDDVVEMRHKLIEILECEFENDISALITSEVGEVVDMIKDLYEAEKYYYEACHLRATYEKEVPQMRKDMSYSSGSGM